MTTEHLSHPGLIPKQPNGFKFWHLKEHGCHLQCCREPKLSFVFIPLPLLKWIRRHIWTVFKPLTVMARPLFMIAQWSPDQNEFLERWWMDALRVFPRWAHRWEARWHLTAIPIITGNTQRDPRAVILQECPLYVESRLGLQDNMASTPEAPTPLSHSKRAGAQNKWENTHSALHKKMFEYFQHQSPCWELCSVHGLLRSLHYLDQVKLLM